MSKTYVEHILELRKNSALRSYEELTKRFVKVLTGIEVALSAKPEDHPAFDEAARAEVLKGFNDELQSLIKQAKIRIEKHTAEVGQYELLNDIRLGKVRLVDPETNEPVKVYFSTLEV